MIFFFVVTVVECKIATIKHALAHALSNNLKRVIFKSGFVQVVNALRIDHFYQ
jgi:hypothetical protein